MWRCKHCKTPFAFKRPSEKANHSRWCVYNPKSAEYRLVIFSKTRGKPWNKGKTKDNDQRMLLISEKMKKHYKESDQKLSFKGRSHTEATKKKMSQKALSNPYRRLRKSTRLYKCRNGSTVLLDSSWEEILAKRLDEINVDWIRPKPIKWVDKKGINHNYFSDFYLPEYDLYLDPKNKFAYKVQKEKIDILNKTYSNIKWLLTEEECKTYKPV